ncbi:hypothetical protein ACIA8O_22500 [Kitasatospora sp. NPDC051853]|uniref:hypothetical protein n=1 Tax=Kitasatospora sp. NPDC051853 TaxID=3364058 RepID=UPI0037B95C17
MSGTAGRACPVCRRPELDIGSGTGSCPGCSWRITGDLFLGAPTAEDLEDERRALEAARGDWEGRAAALAATGPGDPVVGSAALDGLLDELVGTPGAALWFVELTDERVGLVKVLTDRHGVPRAVDAGGAAWTAVLPAFSAEHDRRCRQLAGGTGGLEPIDRILFDEAVRRTLSSLLPAGSGQRTVLLVGRPDWVLHARAAAVLRALRAPDAELGPAPGGVDGVRHLLRGAPLSRGHAVVLAAVDGESGAVRPETKLLFPAGARLRPGESVAVPVTVHGGVDADQPLTLPLVSTGEQDGRGPGGESVLAYRVRLPALRPTELTFVLHGPGEVEVLLPDGSPAEPADADLPALVAGLPRRLARPPRLHLLIAVELCYATGPAEVAARLALLRGLLTELDAEAGQDVEVGVVGYYEHGVRESPYAPRGTLLDVERPGPPAAVLAALADPERWWPAPRRQDTVSALEDALKALNLMAAPGSAGRRRPQRTALLLTARPPAGPFPRGGVPGCPLGVDWQAELAQLRANGVRVLTARDGASAGRPVTPLRRSVLEHVEAAWDALLADGTLDPGRDHATTVAALLPAWHIDGPPLRLALATPLL